MVIMGSFWGPEAFLDPIWGVSGPPKLGSEMTPNTPIFGISWLEIRPATCNDASFAGAVTRLKESKSSERRLISIRDRTYSAFLLFVLSQRSGDCRYII